MLGEIRVDLATLVDANDPDKGEIAKEMEVKLKKCSDSMATLHFTIVSLPVHAHAESLAVATQLPRASLSVNNNNLRKRRGSMTYGPSDSDEDELQSSRENSLGEQEKKKEQSREGVKSPSEGLGSHSEDQLRLLHGKNMDFYAHPTSPYDCDVMMLFADHRKEELKKLLADEDDHHVVDAIYLKAELAGVRRRLEELIYLKLDMIMEEADRRDAQLQSGDSDMPAVPETEPRQRLDFSSQMEPPVLLPPCAEPARDVGYNACRTP